MQHATRHLSLLERSACHIAELQMIAEPAQNVGNRFNFSWLQDHHYDLRTATCHNVPGAEADTKFSYRILFPAEQRIPIILLAGFVRSTPKYSTQAAGNPPRPYLSRRAIARVSRLD
jgi:hypothetical protein